MNKKLMQYWFEEVFVFLRYITKYMKESSLRKKMLYIHTLFWIEAAAKLHIECLMLLIYFKANLQAFSIFLLFSISVCVCVCVRSSNNHFNPDFKGKDIKKPNVWLFSQWVIYTWFINYHDTEVMNISPLSEWDKGGYKRDSKLNLSRCWYPQPAFNW